MWVLLVCVLLLTGMPGSYSHFSVHYNQVPFAVYPTLVKNVAESRLDLQTQAFVSGTWSSCKSCIGGSMIENAVLIYLAYILQMLLAAASAGRTCTMVR